MNAALKKILYPLVLIRRRYDNYLRKKNPEKLLSFYCKRATGKYLNINNPQNLNDKIAYLAYRTDTSEWSRLSDKLLVRHYVEECGYSTNLPILYGEWEKASDIDYDMLPTMFVLKTNHACLTNIFVKDKKMIDVKEINDKLDKWLKWDYGYVSCQPHYSRIKPKIIAEEFLFNNDGKELIDYKFYCINGNPVVVEVCTDRGVGHDVNISVYDMAWNFKPMYYLSNKSRQIEKPYSFSQMIEMAKKLSRRFPFVRVDFYEINKKPILGEMSFMPGYDRKEKNLIEDLGKMLKL